MRLYHLFVEALVVIQVVLSDCLWKPNSMCVCSGAGNAVHRHFRLPKK